MFLDAKTDRGLIRKKNEDFYFIDDKDYRLFLVADGMGGHKAGEVASHKAVEVISSEILNRDSDTDVKTAIFTAVKNANEKIYNMSSEFSDMDGMGTTLTLFYVESGTLHFAHIGDSRAYFVEGDKIKQLTTDHTLVEQFIMNGTLRRDEIKDHPKKHVLIKALGVEKNIDFDYLDYFEIENEKKPVLLCSDGLTDYVTDEEIFNIIMQNRNTGNISQKLVEEANIRGGHDNVTAIFVDFSTKGVE